MSGAILIRSTGCDTSEPLSYDHAVAAGPEARCHAATSTCRSVRVCPDLRDCSMFGDEAEAMRFVERLYAEADLIERARQDAEVAPQVRSGQPRVHRAHAQDQHEPRIAGVIQFQCQSEHESECVDRF